MVVYSLAIIVLYLSAILVLEVTSANHTDSLKFIDDYLDSSINPCDNFHQFVCGKKYLRNASNFIERPTFTATYQGISMDFENDEVVNRFLYLDPPGPHPLGQILPFVTACLNEESREKVGKTVFINLMKALSLTTAFIPDKFEIARILGKLYRNLGNLFLFNLKFMKPKSGKGVLTLPPPYEHINVAEVGVREYAWTMRSIMLPLASELGISRKDVNDDNFYLSLVNIDNTIYNKSEWQTTIDKESSFDPIEDYIDMPTFFDALYEDLLGDQVQNNLSDWTASRNHQIYFKKVLPTVFKHSSKYIVHYLQWRVLKWIGYDLTSDVRNSLYNLRRRPVRMGKQLCLDSVFRLLPDVSLQRYLLQNSINPLSKHEYNMNVNSQVSLLFAIMSKRKMHPFDMIRLKHALDLTIKFPSKRDFPRYKNEKLFYENLEVGEDHLENVLQIRRISSENALKKLYGFPEYKEWLSRPKFYFDSYYLSYESTPPTLYVPLGLLHKPYTGNNIKALDFAAMSFLVFEARIRNGIRYIFDSNVLELWKYPFNETVHNGNQELVQNLEQTIECGNTLYENVTEGLFPGRKLNMNSSRIQRDVFIDGAALELTADSVERQITTKELKNNYYTVAENNYSLPQLFYMHLARIWCDDGLLLEMVDTLLQHGPIPSSLRTNGMLRNFPKFSKAWNCPPDSFMNPSNKCTFFEL